MDFRDVLGVTAILGFGNQGRAQALNLRDSGIGVIIGQREGASADRARAEGFPVLDLAGAVKASQTLMLTLPDETMGDIFAQEIRPHLRPGQTLLFSHGFAIHFGFITPPAEIPCGLVSPKGQARGVRDRYLAGSGVPALLAQMPPGEPHAKSVCLAYAEACGYSKSLLVETSFKEEAETDLFGEQAVLCGGVIDLVKASFETLVEAGYSPESAYFEVFHELKLIVDLMNREGLAEMRRSISDTAEWGGYLAGPKIVTQDTKVALRQLLDRIQDGSFARDWVEEARQGKTRLHQMRSEEAGLEIEEVGVRLRPQIL